MTTKNLMVVVLLAALPAVALAQTAPAPATPAPAAATAEKAQVAARVEFLTGSLKVGEQALSAGDEVFERQTLVTGSNSYANLRFPDGGHVLLRPDSEFTIESYRFRAAPAAASPAPGAVATTAPGAGAGSNAFFRLVRGGFRAISGLIGKGDSAAYKVTTTAATIGIRGTDYEIATCADDCPQQAGASAGEVEVATNDTRGLLVAQGGGGTRAGGIVAATHEGSISLRTSRGEVTVDAGHVLLALNSGKTFVLPAIPDLMIRNPAPSPRTCK